MKNNLFIPVVIVATLAGLAVSLLLHKSAPIQLKALTWFGDQAKPLPAFTLTDHQGEAFTNASFSGQWNLLFFGYTNCPDICPDTLQTMNQMMTLLEDDATREKVHVTFVSVDPDRDNTEKLKSYVQYFNPSFIGVSGEINQIKTLSDEVGILHYIENKEQDYDVGHSAALVLIDPEAKFTGVFGTPHDAQHIAHDMNALING